MAQTVKERKRRQLDRERERLRQLPDSTYPFLTEPFYKWVQGDGDWDSAMFHFDAAAIPQPEFLDDSGPRSIDGEVELLKDEDYDPYAGFEGSIGRAESLVEHLIGAACCIALTINIYKKEQIKKQIRAIENSDLSSPGVRKKALDDMVRLQKMLEHLEKINRVAVHEWRVKGI